MKKIEIKETADGFQVSDSENSYILKPRTNLKKGDLFLWHSRITEEYEIHTFHSDRGYGAKTFTEYNEKDDSSLLVNYSGICGILEKI